MPRSNWFAIRAPLTPRRATVAMFLSFLAPLALWAAICFFWVPDVIITDQGDGSYKPNDRVERAKFDAENARIMAEPAQYRLTDQALESMRTAGVPTPVIAKLETSKGFAWKTRKEFFGDVDLDKKEITQYGDKVWDHLDEAKPKPEVGDPSTVIWLPPPHKVAMAFYYAFVTPPPAKGDPWLHQSLWHSCQIIFWGFLFSAVIGVPLGILCGTFDLFAKISEPFIDFIRYMPAPAFGVLCVAILGIADGPKIAIIWIGTFFQMVLVVANTTRQFDESLLEAAQTLGANKRSLLSKVILPGILPNLYNDMRILLGWAWTYLIVAELIGASSGISYFISQQGRYRRFENAYAGIIMIGLIGLLCDQVLATLARFLFPWVPKKERGGLWASIFAAIAWLPRRLVGWSAPPKPAAQSSHS